jgi:hypothetical protein
MPLHTKPIALTRADELEVLADSVSETQSRLNRIHVRGVPELGANFRDDEYLGDSEALRQLDRPGFQAMRQRFGFRQSKTLKHQSNTSPTRERKFESTTQYGH